MTNPPRMLLYAMPPPRPSLGTLVALWIQAALQLGYVGLLIHDLYLQIEYVQMFGGSWSEEWPIIFCGARLSTTLAAAVCVEVLQIVMMLLALSAYIVASVRLQRGTRVWPLVAWITALVQAPLTVSSLFFTCVPPFDDLWVDNEFLVFIIAYTALDSLILILDVTLMVVLWRHIKKRV